MQSLTLPKFPRICAASLLAATLSFCAPARAQTTYYWDSNDATTGFGTAGGTWAAPTTNNSTQGWSTSSAGVNALSGTTNTTTSDALNFGTGTASYGLGAGTITVSGTVSANSLTFGSQSGAIILSGGTIALGGTTPTITVNNAADTISSAITGSAGLTKNGTGILTLSGNSTYTGTTTINAGTLKAGSTTGLSSSSAVSVAAGSFLDLAGFNNTISSLSTATGTITNTGSTANLTLTAVGSGAAQLFTGNMGLVLNTDTVFTNANSTYSGGTFLNSGRLILGSYALGVGTPGALTNGLYGTGAITIGNSTASLSQLYLAGNSLGVINNAIIVNSAQGTHPTELGAFRIAGSGPIIAGAINANLASATFNSLNSGQTVTVTGAISGISGLTVMTQSSGGLNVTLNNAGTANSYAGDTTINTANATLTLGRADQISNGVGKGNLIINSGTFNMAGFSETINGLSGNGTVNGVSGTPTLTVGDNNATSTFSGVIKNTAGALALTKTGTGSLTLSGINTYTGATTISAGTIQIGHASGLGVGGNITFGGGGLQYGSGITADVSARFKNSAAAILIDTNSNNVTFASAVDFTNSAGLTKNGTGTLTLSGNNTYTGATAINSGMIQIGHASGLGVGGNITFGGGALQYGSTITTDISSRLKNSASAILIDTNSNIVTFANVVDSTNSGGLTKNGTGTLTLSGNNTYTGATAINSGTLTVGNGSSSSSYTTASGAVLNLGSSPSVNFSLLGNGTVNITGALSAGSNALTIGMGSGGLIDVKSGASISYGFGNDPWTSNLADLNVVGTIYGAGNNIVVNALTGNSTTFSIGGATIVVGVNNGNGTYTGTLTRNYADAHFRKEGSGTQTLNGAIDLGANGTITQIGSGNLVINGPSQNGSVTQNGTGTLTLSGNNTYSGTTTISAGTLEIGASGRLGAGNYTQNILNNGTFIYSGTSNQTLTGIISGTGSLIQNGVGSTLTINSSSTFSGAKTINAGTLRLAAPGTVTIYGGNSTVNINNGSTLQLAFVAGMANNPPVTGLIVNIDGSGGSTVALDGINGLIQSSAGVTFNTNGGAQNRLISLNGGFFNDQGGNQPVFFNVASGSNATADFLVTGGMARSSITKNGTGKLLFSNTAVGSTSIANIQINQGTMEFGGTSTLNQAAGFVFANNGTLSWNSTASQTLSNNITGTGSLVKSNTSTLTLSGNNSYSGTTTVNAGTLAVSGNISSSAVTVNAGVISAGSAAAVTKFNAASLTLSADSGYAFTIGNISGGTTGTAGTDYDQIATSGALTFNNTLSNPFTVYINGTPTNWSSTGNYTWNIMSGSSISGFSSANFFANTLGFGSSLDAASAFTFGTSGGNLTLTYALTGTPTWAGGTGVWSEGFTPSVSNNLNMLFAGAGGNATNDIASATFDSVGAITFNATAGSYTLGANSGTAGNSSSLVLLGGIVNNSANGQTINTDLSFVGARTINTASGNITIGGVISGAGGVSKTGSRTLTLSGNNTYSGGTTVSAGTLSLTGNLAGGTAITVSGNAVLTQGSASLISGLSSFTHNSTGTSTLSGNNTYSGGTTLSAGTISVTNANGLGNGSVMAAANTKLFLAPSTGNMTFANAVSLAGGSLGSIEVSGTVTTTGLITLTGGADFRGSNLIVGGGITSANNSGINFNLTTAINSVISIGTGDLSVTSATTLMNATGNTFRDTIINFNGNLTLGINNALPSSTKVRFGFSSAANSVATLNLNGYNQTVASLEGAQGNYDTQNQNITGGGVLTVNQIAAQAFSYGGRITDGVTATSLTKNGSGTLMLQNRSGINSTYSGATTINAGTLMILAGNGTSLSASSAYTVASGAVLSVNGTSQRIGSLAGAGTVQNGNATTATTLTVGVDNTNTTFSGVLQNGGAAALALTKNGTGVFTLASTNTYTGATTLNGGTLQLSSNITSSALTLGTGSVISIGNTTTTAKYNVASVTTQGGSGYAFTIANVGASVAGTDYDQLTATGALTLSNTAASPFTIYLNGTPTAWSNSGNYSWNIISAASQTGFSSGNFALEFANFGIAAPDRTGIWSFTNPSGGLLTLNYAAAGDSFWTGTSGNWSTGFTPTPPSTDQNIFFSGSGGTATNDIASGTLSSLNFITFNSTASSYTLNATTGAAGLAGGTALNFKGDIINNSASTQTINMNLSVGASSSGGIAANAGNITIAGVISGLGGLNKSGNSTLLLIGANTYSGATTVNAGTLNLTGNLSGGTAISVVGSSVLTQGTASIISGTSSLTHNSTGTSTLAGANTYSGATTVNAGTLNLTGNSSGGTAISARESGVLTQGAASIISGTSSLTHNSTGTSTLAGANTYNGATTLNAGTLNLNHATAIGSGVLTLTGGTLNNTSGAAITLTNNNTQNWNGNFTFTGTKDLNLGTGAVTMNASRTITVSNGTLTAQGLISGSGFGLTKNGSGTLTINSSSTFTGAKTVNAGTLRLVSPGGGSSAFGSNNTVNINNQSTLQIGWVGANNPSFGGNTVNFDTNGGGTLLNDDLNGLIQFGGFFTINTNGGAQNQLNAVGSGIFNDQGANGGLILNVASGSNATADLLLAVGGAYAITKNGTGKVLVTASPTLRGITINNGVLEFGGSSTPTFSSTLAFTNNGTFSWNSTASATITQNMTGSGSLTKGSTSTLTLSGSNTYTGATTINAGTLQITSTGLLGGGSYSGNIVNSGAFLVASDSNQSLSGIISGTGALTKNGSGALMLSGSNTYSGGTTLNTGTLVIGHANSAGTGTITQPSGSSLLKFDTTGTITNAMSVYNVQASQSATLSGAISVNNASFDVDSGDTLTLSGAVSGSGGVTKNGNGTLVLSGSNTYAAATTVNAGTLNAASASALGNSTVINVDGGSFLVTAANAVNDNAAVNLGGGRMAVSGNFDETVGLLTLSANSTIDFSGFAGTLRFGGIGSWASGATLAIWNWSGTTQYGTQVNNYANPSKLVFTDNSNLNSNLSLISFYSDSGSSFVGNGFQQGFSPGGGTEIIAVPEPEAFFYAAALLAGIVVQFIRRRAKRKSSELYPQT